MASAFKTEVTGNTITVTLNPVLGPGGYGVDGAIVTVVGPSGTPVPPTADNGNPPRPAPVTAPGAAATRTLTYANLANGSYLITVNCGGTQESSGVQVGVVGIVVRGAPAAGTA